MNETPEIPPQQPEPPRAPDCPPAKPSLTASLRKDYEALQEDLRQAHETTANLETQLAGKSKELLHLKFLFEQTKAHLAHMQDGIVAMRMERHKLANEAMRAMGLDIMVARLTAERDRLKSELDGILEGLAIEKAEKELRFDKRDHHIAEITLELMKLRQEVAELRRSNPRPAAPAPAAPPPRELPLKTAAEEFIKHDPAIGEMEIIPTERVAGHRGKA